MDKIVKYTSLVCLLASSAFGGAERPEMAYLVSSKSEQIGSNLREELSNFDAERRAIDNYLTESFNDNEDFIVIELVHTGNWGFASPRGIEWIVITPEIINKPTGNAKILKDFLTVSITSDLYWEKVVLLLKAIEGDVGCEYFEYSPASSNRKIIINRHESTGDKTVTIFDAWPSAWPAFNHGGDECYQAESIRISDMSHFLLFLYSINEEQLQLLRKLLIVDGNSEEPADPFEGM